MSAENRTPTGQFVEMGFAPISLESASDAGYNLQSLLLERRLWSSEVDRRINAMVAPIATHLETLMQSVRKPSGRTSNRLTEKNVASERSR